jgi:prefoldin subunit 5
MYLEIGTKKTTETKSFFEAVAAMGLFRTVDDEIEKVGESLRYDPQQANASLQKIQQELSFYQAQLRKVQKATSTVEKGDDSSRLLVSYGRRSVIEGSAFSMSMIE